MQPRRRRSPIFRQRLTFPTGRNPRPSTLHWLEGRTPDLYYSRSYDDLAHPSLSRPDGEVFIVLYDAGRTTYL
jgi:hypothetical protein